MTAPSFTVETRGQAALIIGGTSSLQTLVIEELEKLALHAVKLTSSTELTEITRSYDPDYLVLFQDREMNNWLEKEGGELAPILHSLIQSGETRLIVVQHQEYTETKLPFGPATRTIIFTDYIGKNDIVSRVITHWLISAKDDHKVLIPGDGLEEISILGEHDLARILAQAIVQPMRQREEQVYIGNPEKISLSNLAYNFRSRAPFKIEVSFGGDEAETYEQEVSVYGDSLKKLHENLTENIDNLLEDYLDRYFAGTKTNEDAYVQPIKETVIPRAYAPMQQGNIFSPTPLKKLTSFKPPRAVFVPLTSQKKRYKISLPKLQLPKLGFPRKIPGGQPSVVAIFGKGILFAIAFYLGSLAFALTISCLSAKNIYQALQNDSLPIVNKFNSFSGTYLEANWVVITGVPGFAHNEMVQNITRLLDSYNQTLRMFKTAGELNATSKNILEYIVGAGTSDMTNSLSQARRQVEELYQELSLLYGVLPTDRPAIIPTRYTKAYEQGRAKIGQLQRRVVTQKGLLTALPNLIGLGGRKKYAVLLQDNLELRPTGGFIGSFAILSFENGKLYDMPAYNVYSVDSQLKGHIEPPKAIKEFLGETNWYLRDSNFDPDFPTSARRAEWFIKKTLNQDVDGTIALDINSFKSLLTILGPLSLDDQTVTADNLYERLMSYTQANFAPDAGQKKDFLSMIATTIFTKLPTVSGDKGMKLIGELASSLETKDSLMSLTNSGDDRIFAALNWTGQLNDLPCPVEQNCQKDYAMVVESNFGVNKANYYLKRSAKIDMQLDENMKVQHVLGLTYKNTATTSSWPGGEYKNYERIYLPPNTFIQSIRVGTHELDSKEYTITVDHNKMSVGYLMTVPVASDATVQITYELPAPVTSGMKLYTWYWQKQPGTSQNDPIVVTLKYPSSRKPIVISPEAKLGDQELQFNFYNDTDHRLTVKFAE